MSDATLPSLSALPLDLARAVDAACRRFEEACQRWDQRRPRLEDFLSTDDPQGRADLLAELLRLEIAYRQRLPEPLCAEEFRQRFPGVPWLDGLLQEAGVVDADDPDATLPGPGPGTGDAGIPPGYAPLGELGRGGMGVVHRVRHRKLNRVCALKFIRAGQGDPETARERFAAEARAVAALAHPHVVRIFEVGEHNGAPFMALEYCPGGSLDQRLAGQPMSVREAAELVRALALGVQAAHEANVVHRDLKPGNVLFAADGTPRVADFGLAKNLDEAGRTETGTALGTPSYMARGESNRAVGCDVWALGAILYRCLSFWLAVVVLTPGGRTVAAEAVGPNVVVLLADDLGYGDVGCYNPERGKIPTPRIDRLAKEGMRFTDAHSSSGVCSPTRYSLLTGRYHWRTRLQAGIVGVWGKPLIAPDRLTIAGLARQHGYHTACVGKWHLGWDWPIAEGDMKHFRGLGGQAGGGGKVNTEATPEQVAAWKKVFEQPIPGGPTTRGFHDYFGTDVPNWPPYCFLENDRTAGVPSVLQPAADFVRNQASLQGPALPGWKLDAVLPALADRACEILAKQATAEKPFLLYLPLTVPHTPLAVGREWQGKSDLKHPYADFVMQTDATVGRILDALAKAGIADKTLVIFTSDNGCAPYIGAKDLEAKGHFPSGPLRGYKADAWEGGHRVPFLVRWPGVVRPGTTCGQTIGSVDILATLAAVWGAKLPAGAGEDSVSLLPLLRGEDRPIHEAVVQQSSQGIFALRSGKWKLIFGPGSGAANATKPHLYDLSADLGETKDLAEARPDEVKRLTESMERLIADGRSTPGEKQSNDVAVRLIKMPRGENPPAQDEAGQNPQ